MIRCPAVLLRSSLALICLFALAAGNVTRAAAQSYPARSIKLVVPFGPGGPTDVSARIVAQVVQAGLGTSVVIENRPGAGGAIGTKSVANADPDGATLLIGTSATLGVVPALVKNPGYDPIKSFAPVAKVADSTLVLVVPANFPANSVQEFVAHAKANPGKLAYSSAGFGSFSHLGGAMFTSRAGIELLHVPYKGAFPAVQALLSDQVQVYVGNFAELHPLVEAGKLRLLAVAARERLAQTPDLPTIAETLPGFQMAGWQGLLAPARTPPPIVSRLEQQAIAAARSPSAIARLRNLSVTAVGSTAAEFVESIRKDIELYQRVTKAAGLEKQN